MDTLAPDFDKVAKRQKLCADKTLAEMDKLVAAFTDTKTKLAAAASSNSDTTSLAASLAMLANKVKTISAQMSDQHKELHNAIGKYGKALDKKFKTDLNNVWDPKAFDGKEDIFNKAIALHFYREGRFDIGDLFVQEAHVGALPDSIKSQFLTMFHILEAMKAQNLEPAIAWVSQYRGELEKRGSSLEFQLHRLQFIQYLLNYQPEVALRYAKTHLGRFARSHMKEIMRLTTSILYLSRLANSPYSDLLSPHVTTDVAAQFTRDFCALLGLSADSPLFTSATAGSSALPTIFKMSSIMKDQSGLEWTQQGELPVEIPLQESQRLHSIFACPVSRETSSEDNPPMMLVCGHAIVKESLTRLSKGSMNARFKCPYCPTESTAAQAVRIYF